jgi:hypothetical protein
MVLVTETRVEPSAAVDKAVLPAETCPTRVMLVYTSNMPCASLKLLRFSGVASTGNSNHLDMLINIDMIKKRCRVNTSPITVGKDKDRWEKLSIMLFGLRDKRVRKDERLGLKSGEQGDRHLGKAGD